MTNNTFYQLIRRPQVLGLTARSKSALQLDEKAGIFCPAISIGYRAVAYVKSEVEAVIQARIEGQSTEQIKQLVQELINQRHKAARGQHG
jgi:prophage regulatory protein